MKYALIAQRVYNTPLLMNESKLEVILGVLAGRFGIAPPEGLTEAPAVSAAASRVGFENRASAMYPGSDDAAKAAGIQVLEIDGTLVHRYATAPSGATSYDWISDRLATAVADPGTKAVLLRFDSFGGEVAGIWTLAEQIRAAAQKKPVWASIDNHAFSAAYALASQADRVFVNENSGVGSIGVIAVHLDLSAALKREGVKPTIIHAGKHKADGNKYEPLPDEVAARIQAMVNAEYDRFVAAVAEGRGISPEAVRETEAQSYYDGRVAIDLGLADEIGSFQDAVAQLSAAAKRPAVYFTQQQPSGAAAREQENRMSQEVATETNTASLAAGSAPSPEVVEQAAKARIASILTCLEATGREELARHVALQTNLTAVEASALLAVSPKHQPKAAATPLERFMATEAPNPEVVAKPQDSGVTEKELAASILNAAKKKEN